MIDFSSSNFNDIIIHQVGNQLRDEGIVQSKSFVDIGDEQIKLLLSRYFLNPFKMDEYYTFAHNSSLDLNEVFTYCKEIFENRSSMPDQSVNIANHLYKSSTHPKVKGGELYVVLLEDCVVDGELVDAIGLFKSENKEPFLKVFPSGSNFEIDYENGINISKLDKGALIFNTEKEIGYKLCIVDNLNKGKEARYWKDDFLGVSLRNDDFYQTKNYISFCEQLVTKGSLDHAIDEKEKIDLMVKSANFFKDNDHFNEEKFKQEVLKDETLLETYEEFKDDFQNRNDIQLEGDFGIDSKVVKEKVKRLTKTLLLDQNFKIQIYNNSELVSKGYDEQIGMNFYKFYYSEEN